MTKKVFLVSLIALMLIAMMGVASAASSTGRWSDPTDNEMMFGTVTLTATLSNASCSANCGADDKQITNTTFTYTVAGGSPVAIGQNVTSSNVSAAGTIDVTLDFDTNILSDATTYTLTFNAYNYTVPHADNLTVTNTTTGIISDNSAPTCTWVNPLATASDSEMEIPFSFKLTGLNSSYALVKVNKVWQNMTRTIATANSETYVYNMTRGLIGEGTYDIEAITYDRGNATTNIGHNSTECAILKQLRIDEPTSSVRVRLIAEQEAYSSEQGESLLKIGAIFVLGYLGYTYWWKKKGGRRKK